MPTATATRTKTAPARAAYRAAAKSAPASVARTAAPRHEAAAAPTPEIVNRPEYSPLGIKLFYYDDPNFRITDDDVNRILYGQS
jgi:hypothetical protein